MIFSTDQKRKAQKVQPSAHYRHHGNSWQYSSRLLRETSCNLAWTLSSSRDFPFSQVIRARGYLQRNDLLQWQQTLNDWEPCIPPIAPLTAKRVSSWSFEEESKQNGWLHQLRSTHNRQQTEDGQKFWQLKQNTCYRHRNYVKIIGSVTRSLKFKQRKMWNQQGATLMRS